MVTDLHAKNQVHICKRLAEKSGKLVLRTDGRTDRRTDGLTDGQSANLKSPLALPVGD